MNGLVRRAPADALADLLDAQRMALRGGRLDTLADMAPRLQRALADFSASPDADRLPGLRRDAARNAVLIQAALEGLSRVRADRMAIAQSRLSTYDATGRLRDTGRPPQTVLTRR